MTDKQFKAMIVEEKSKGQFVRRIDQRSTADLPAGDLLIKVHYSSLNYKDALSATGNKGVTRNYPHTPGVDAAGVVEESSHPDFKAGDEVIAIGYDLGMNTDGGFGQYIRVPAEWAVKLPSAMSLRESMQLGTAGFTAAMGLEKLLRYGVKSDRGPIIVTGATGGVGSVAISLLANAGYHVVAATGKLNQANYLQRLGAKEVIHRDELKDESGRPMLKGRWAGAIDTVGGEILATILKSTEYGGVVTCCGLVASPELSTTVFPFILRGVSLIGIESVNAPIDYRKKIWHKLATDWNIHQIETIAWERSLSQLSKEIDLILEGGQIGRILVNLQGYPQ